MDYKTQIKQLNKGKEEMAKETTDLKNENKAEEGGKVDVSKQSDIWREENRKNKVDWKSIPEQQQEKMEKGITKVVQTNENQVGDIAEKRKKGIIICEIKEVNITLYIKRVRKKIKEMKDILQKLDDEDEETKFKDEIEGITILGKYEIEETRPMRVTLESQAKTEKILTRTFVLKRMRWTKMYLSKEI